MFHRSSFCYDSGGEWWRNHSDYEWRHYNPNKKPSERIDATEEGLGCLVSIAKAKKYELFYVNNPRSNFSQDKFRFTRYNVYNWMPFLFLEQQLEFPITINCIKWNEIIMK